MNEGVQDWDVGLVEPYFNTKGGRKGGKKKEGKNKVSSKEKQKGGRPKQAMTMVTRTQGTKRNQAEPDSEGPRETPLKERHQEEKWRRRG